MTRAAAVIAAATAFSVTACTGKGASTGQLPLRRVADVPLSGAASRFDYQSLDRARNRLYISHLRAGAIVAVDIRRRKVLATIGGVPGAHGVLVVPSLGRVFAAATTARQLVTIREQTGTVLRRVPAGSYPDGIAYDAAHQLIFVSDESGGAEIVAGARTGLRIARIALGGQAGNVQYDPVSRHVLVDIQTRDELGVIDPVRREVIARYSLPACNHDHGLHLDPSRRLAFIACGGNATLVVFDLRTNRVTARFSVGAHPDVLDLDTSLHRLYVAAESGVVAVFAQRARTLRKLGQHFLAPHAHSVAVDPRTHLVYFPLENVRGRPVLRIFRPTG